MCAGVVNRKVLVWECGDLAFHKDAQELGCLGKFARASYILVKGLRKIDAFQPFCTLLC